MAVPAPDAIKILGKEATHDEIRILGAFQYIYRHGFLITDDFMGCLTHIAEFS